MGIAPKVALAKSFLTALNRVPKPIRKRVNELITKFSENPTGSNLNFESLAGMRDPKVRTLRVNQQYRAVLMHPPKGNVYLFVWVDNHDEAMAWAKNKVFDVNATTGALQVLDMEYVETATEEIHTPPAEAVGLFKALSDDDLAKTGLPAVLLPTVRAIFTEAQLDEVQPFFPQESFEALFLVASGYDLDTALRESSRSAAKEAAQIDTEDFAAALERPTSRREFRLAQTEDELTEMLDSRLDTWRVFLHPNQEAIVRTNFKGPARVLGGAGTGKTVVAMHRARHLAKKFDGEKILFTTFNRNLAKNISELLDGFCGAERKLIEVTNIHAWAVQYANKSFGKVTIASAPQQKECWEAVGGDRAALDWNRKDYETEWKDVVEFHGVEDRSQYLKVSRAGSKKKLKRAGRGQIWEGLAAYRAELDKRGLMDWTDVVRKVRIDLEAKDESPYRAVVIDEAQDIDAEQWRLLKALAPDADNNLFITGDGHQRIYGKPIVLSHFGIHIRGRARRLKINYRTTEQVLRWATALLKGADIDDLDGGTDNTVGYRSLYTGPEPDIHSFTSDRQQAEFLVERIRELTTETPPEEIAVVTKYRKTVGAFSEFLADAGIENTILDGDSSGPGIRLATMHRVKGLDFSHVIMHLPDATGGSKDPRDQSLLYVAATRCRKTLTVLRAG